MVYILFSQLYEISLVIASSSIIAGQNVRDRTGAILHTALRFQGLIRGNGGTSVSFNLDIETYTVQDSLKSMPLLTSPTLARMLENEHGSSKVSAQHDFGMKCPPRKFL